MPVHVVNSFAVQKLCRFMPFHLFMFTFIVCAFGVLTKKSIVMKLLPIFFSSFKSCLVLCREKASINKHACRNQFQEPNLTCKYIFVSVFTTFAYTKIAYYTYSSSPCFNFSIQQHLLQISVQLKQRSSSLILRATHTPF